jgi:hypothetical protein
VSQTKEEEESGTYKSASYKGLRKRNGPESGMRRKLEEEIEIRRRMDIE